MRLLEDGLVAALSSIGLVTVIFLAISAVVHPRCRGTLDTLAVVPCCGGADRLEHTVRALERLRYERGGFTRIIILDCGLDEDAKRVAALLCRDDYDVTLCDRAALLDRIEQE